MGHHRGRFSNGTLLHEEKLRNTHIRHVVVGIFNLTMSLPLIIRDHGIFTLLRKIAIFHFRGLHRSIRKISFP